MNISISNYEVFIFCQVCHSHVADEDQRCNPQYIDFIYKLKLTGDHKEPHINTNVISDQN